MTQLRLICRLVTVLQPTFHFASAFKPILLHLRFIGGYSLLGLVGWSLVSFAIDAYNTAKKMHQIPCTKCRFFTGDHRLKCTVNPHVANTEEAIDCPDRQTI